MMEKDEKQQEQAWKASRPQCTSENCESSTISARLTGTPEYRLPLIGAICKTGMAQI